MNPHPSLPQEFGEIYGHRRLWRQFTTQELALRNNHIRKRAVIRGGVLVLFGFAMVAYPIFGTLSSTASAVNAVPGVVLGEAPETIEVLLGEGPAMRQANLPLPSLEEHERILATSSEYIVSNNLPNCSGVPVGDPATWVNGALPEDTLCTLWDKRNKVRADAAVALANLNYAFKLRFGHNLCIQSSYRTIGDQYRVIASRGWLAAPAGKSNHGWALAIDLCGGDDRGERFEWLKANAPAYDWVNPPWASTIKYEPWHFEYVPGTVQMGTFYDDKDAADGAANEGTGEGEVPDVIDTILPSPEPTPSPTPEPEPSA